MTKQIEQRLAQYKELTKNITKLEEALVRVKGMKSDVAKALLEENGKEQLYDLGDGVPLFVSGTKIGTYFLAPRKRGRKKGKAKTKTKKVIENGQVVEKEVPVATGAPLPPGKGRVIEAEATLTGKGAVLEDTGPALEKVEDTSPAVKQALVEPAAAPEPAVESSDPEPATGEAPPEEEKEKPEITPEMIAELKARQGEGIADADVADKELESALSEAVENEAKNPPVAEEKAEADPDDPLASVLAELEKEGSL